MTYPRESRLVFFERFYDDWQDASVLDFGGNAGNILHDLKIMHPDYNEANYTCLDTDQLALDQGARDSPNASWHKHSGRSPVYNPHGDDYVSFPYPDNHFDITVSFSVHTHMTCEQMWFDLSEMKRVTRGPVVFSYLVPESMKYFINRRKEQYGHAIEQSAFDDLQDVVYLVNADELTPQATPPYQDMVHFLSVYNREWLFEQLVERGFQPTYGEEVKTSKTIGKSLSKINGMGHVKLKIYLDAMPQKFMII